MLYQRGRGLHWGREEEEEEEKEEVAGGKIRRKEKHPTAKAVGVEKNA